MFVAFLTELRARRVPVGVQEAVTLARALAQGLHESSLDGFYFTARALLVHSERHLDDFDLAFAKYFRGIEIESKKVTDDLIAWLEDADVLAELSPEQRELLSALEPADLQRQFEERLRNQRERHDGGSRWVGNGGTSPFGRGGVHPSGLSVGGGSRRQQSALASADARHYRSHRSDVLLDARQIELALRTLRVFGREGAERELDIEATIDQTARNAGELEIVTRPPRRPNTRVILLMDVGGSMDPHTRVVSQLFSASKRATHFKELRTYYFHNCVYGSVYGTEGFRDETSVEQLVRECGRHYKLVLVGDAAMASYELLGGSAGDAAADGLSGLGWLVRLRQHFERSVWLNPEPPAAWDQFSVSAIRGVFPMFPLTVDGLGAAVRELTAARAR